MTALADGGRELIEHFLDITYQRHFRDDLAAIRFPAFVFRRRLISRRLLSAARLPPLFAILSASSRGTTATQALPHCHRFAATFDKFGAPDSRFSLPVATALLMIIHMHNFVTSSGARAIERSYER